MKVWEALQNDGWSDDDLARLQASCQKPEFIMAMTHALEGERIFADAGYDLCRKSNDDAFNTLEWQTAWAEQEDQPRATSRFFRKQIYCRIWRFAWSYQDQRHNLEELQALVEITRKAAIAKSYSDSMPFINKITMETEKRNWYDRLRFGVAQSGLSLSRADARAMHIETERSQILCAIGLKRYVLRHGQFPASLDDLVPEFLPAVPTDYMDGKPMKYRLNADGSFLLYSAGEDGKDDDGDISLPPERNKSLNLWARKDFIWPAPALPDEVAIWREEAAKN
jgi:hypothetical protein